MAPERLDLVRVTAGWEGAATPEGAALNGDEVLCGVCGRVDMAVRGVFGAEALLRDTVGLMAGVEDVEDVDWPGACCGRLGV